MLEGQMAPVLKAMPLFDVITPVLPSLVGFGPLVRPKLF